MLVGIVRIALKRPYTFVVMAMLILLIGPLAALRTPTDIFPRSHPGDRGGLELHRPAARRDGAAHRRRSFERALTTTVNDIEHIEAQSLHRHRRSSRSSSSRAPTSHRDRAGHGDRRRRAAADAARHHAAADHQLQRLDACRSSSSRSPATACPSSSCSTSAINFVRTPLVTVPGAAIPFPYGGKQRQILVDLDPQALQARGLSASDVANALVGRRT